MTERGEIPSPLFRTGFRRNTSKKGIDKLCVIWYNNSVRKRGEQNEKDLCFTKSLTRPWLEG